MEKEEDLVKKAFNSGFLIAQHNPDLFRQLSGSFAHNENNQYLEAFKKGAQAFEKDKEPQKAPKNVQIKKPIDKGK